MSNRQFLVFDENNEISDYRKSSKINKQNTSSEDKITISEVIQFCNSNKKDKSVRKDTKDLLIEYLNQKYINYVPPKKKK